MRSDSNQHTHFFLHHRISRTTLSRGTGKECASCASAAARSSSVCHWMIAMIGPLSGNVWWRFGRYKCVGGLLSCGKRQVVQWDRDANQFTTIGSGTNEVEFFIMCLLGFLVGSGKPLNSAHCPQSVQAMCFPTVHCTSTRPAELYSYASFQPRRRHRTFPPLNTPSAKSVWPIASVEYSTVRDS